MMIQLFLITILNILLVCIVFALLVVLAKIFAILVNNKIKKLRRKNDRKKKHRYLHS